MEFLRKFAVAGAGTNYLNLTLRKGDVLRIVNLLNEVTHWGIANIVIAKDGSENTDGNTIALVHNRVQNGNKDLHWEGEIKISGQYTIVRATFFNCTASDPINLTVGIE